MASLVRTSSALHVQHNANIAIRVSQCSTVKGKKWWGYSWYDNRYAPAQNEFGQNISIVHFIGENKPWKYQRFADGKVLPLGSTWEGTKHMIQAWWNTWDTYYGQVSVETWMSCLKATQLTSCGRLHHTIYSPVSLITGSMMASRLALLCLLMKVSRMRGIISQWIGITIASRFSLCHPSHPSPLANQIG